MKKDHFAEFEKFLPFVRSPGQYIGGEFNSIVKPDARLRFALCFPDTYAIGMSHLGIQILYHIVNGLDGVAAERFFAPEADMEAELRKRGIPLLSLETHRPLCEFDLVGFSIQYELCYTNVLTMLDLGGITLRACERREGEPLVIAGGATVFAPEPMADFFDLFVLGDGEEAVVRLCEIYEACRGQPRAAVVEAMARGVPGAYAPSLYEAEYSSGKLAAIRPRSAAAAFPVRKAVVQDLESAPFPTAPIVPFVETVHERIVIEVSRGCPHGCRFCQAGSVRKPVRHRSIRKVIELAEESYRHTGYDEIALAALSVTDYPDLVELVRRLNERFEERRVGVSLPSLRIGRALLQMPAVVSAVRKSGLTLAPEAATDRLRAIIRKNVTDADLFEAAESAYEHGWRLLKLYFMIGLPGESDKDAEAIPELAWKLSELRRKIAGGPAAINVTVSTFIPKPHTPFQWDKMATEEYIAGRQYWIRKHIPAERIHIKFSPFPVSLLEAVLCRGDRRVSKLIECAWRRGARLDAWNEHFRFESWRAAFEESGIDPSFYAHREIPADECLPWEHIDSGHSKQTLLRLRGQT